MAHNLMPLPHNLLGSVTGHTPSRRRTSNFILPTNAFKLHARKECVCGMDT